MKHFFIDSPDHISSSPFVPIDSDWIEHNLTSRNTKWEINFEVSIHRRNEAAVSGKFFEKRFNLFLLKIEAASNYSQGKQAERLETFLDRPESSRPRIEENNLP